MSEVNRSVFRGGSFLPTLSRMDSRWTQPRGCVFFHAWTFLVRFRSLRCSAYRALAFEEFFPGVAASLASAETRISKAAESSMCAVWD